MIDDEIKEWIKKAENDLKVVEHELKLSEGEIAKEDVCFHCQQAIEKYLKAFLMFHDVKYKRTHDISYLLNECGKIDNDFSNIEIRNISFFAVEIRYPDVSYEPSIEEVKFYHELVKQIEKLVLTKLDIEENA